jgi:hypothetical protein
MAERKVKMIKLTIDENLPMVAYRQAEQIKEEWENTIYEVDNQEMAAHVYGDKHWANFVHYTKAEITAKRGGWFNTKELDVYIEAVIECNNCITKVGYYLSDLWESTGDNRNELRELAYIRNYRLEK